MCTIHHQIYDHCDAYLYFRGKNATSFSFLPRIKGKNNKQKNTKEKKEVKKKKKNAEQNAIKSKASLEEEKNLYIIFFTVI